MQKTPKIAVVCDWLETYAGAERVLEQILLLYPQAELFALVDFLPDTPQARAFIGGRKPRTTWIQRLPLARKHFRQYLPLFPLAIQSLDLSGYDIIISSSHCVAKGVRVRPGQIHVCYCHTPVRYAWDLREEYLRETGKDKGAKSAIIRLALEYLRRWDKASAPRVTYYIANSRFIAKRIKDYYGREADVIYPPVAVEDFPLFSGARKNVYFAGSRQVPYKKIHLIAEAFKRMPERSLVIVGNGPEHNRITAVAAGAPNITLVTEAPFPVLKEAMSTAKAMLFMAKEDFGIMPVEAMACGTPVIAFGQGGVAESVCGLEAKAPTGVFFAEQTPEAVMAAVETFEHSQTRIPPAACRARAEEFSVEAFRSRFNTFMQKHVFS